MPREKTFVLKGHICINRQGGMRSYKLRALAQKLLVWTAWHFLSFRVTHVLGFLNRGADLLSRGNPLYGEWWLHPQIVRLLWERFGQAAVDLFASRKNAHCPIFFSLRDEDTPLGVDALACPWPSALLYTFPPLCLMSPTLARVAVQGLSLILIAPRQGGSLGLACERVNLNTLGLPPRVIATIQNARASSTRSLYDCKWHVFEEWCEEHQLVSYLCSVADILGFLQDLIDCGRTFSMIKVYLAAIAACHTGFSNIMVGQHPLIRRFMKGARSLPVTRSVVPDWDLSMVLEVLAQQPFEPLGDISLKLLSFKTVLLLALASAKGVSDLHALSFHSSCTKFSLCGDSVLLRPDSAFMPKCFPAFTVGVIELSAFHPPPFSSAEDQRLNALCPVRALRAYMVRTNSFWRSDQLFVSWAPPNTGKPISKQRLSCWLVGAISLAYESRSVQPPGGLRAHSTRGLAASWALFGGVPLQDICAAVSWSSPHTFVRHYRLDVTRTTVAHAVLCVGSS
ncbi:uncharacterized protein LOC132859430 [Tachysurus vachellii]|uniref:uncharacterized protein LOC132859430 n=1 Tax=Tachysurus vachellii TaxID=175792 RepID=UPI00296AE4A9|nr:uncharacterized protein LOC132859430 [Tachysurus vachellii]